jgi:hypothetical protein
MSIHAMRLMFRDKRLLLAVPEKKRRLREAVPNLDHCSSILMDTRVDILTFSHFPKIFTDS